MELGLFTLQYKYLSLEQAFKDGKDFGYDFIELWGGRPHGYTYDILNGGLKDILNLRDRYEMPIKVFTPEHNDYPFNYMISTDNQYMDIMEYFKNSIKVTKMLGAKYMLVSGGHGRDDEAYDRRWKRLIRAMKDISKYGEDEDVTIIFETLTPYESNICTRLDELERLLNEIDSPNFAGMLDLVAPFSQKEDPVDYVRRLGNRIKHIHLVDSDGISESHIIPGDGIMDIKNILSDIKKLGYDNGATIELVTNYIYDPSKYSKLAIERARCLL